jgi:type II secretory pathway component PulJ
MNRGQIAKRAGKALAVAVVTALLLFVTVPSASARDYDDRGRCRERIERAEFKLDKEIRRHGPYSRQAEKKRRELREERARCWNRGHSWWDGRSQSWHNDRDWDRDDHDRDRYRDDYDRH